MDNLYYRIKSYLRKKGILDHYQFGVANSSGEWIITHWSYEIPRPDVSEVPNLTEEEYFVQQEDTNFYTNDVYVVSTDGSIKPDRRCYLSGLSNNEMVLEAARYQVCSEPMLKLYVNGVESKSIIKAITPVRLSVETPSEETTLVIWRI